MPSGLTIASGDQVYGNANVVIYLLGRFNTHFISVKLLLDVFLWRYISDWLNLIDSDVTY